MTLAELERAVASKKRIRRLEAREKAQYDHVLGQLIGIACGKAFGSVKKEYPSLDAAYPSLFTAEEILKRKQEQQAGQLALKFRQFAESFNSRYRARTEVAEVE